MPHFPFPVNARGAVLLLSVYFAALTMLILSGVALQRTTTELRAVQLARDQEQAFFLAEAGIDWALQALRPDPLAIPSGIVHTVPTPHGTIEYQTTVLTTTLDNAKLTRVLQIRATGRPAGTTRTTDVIATVRTEQTLNSLFSLGAMTSFPWLSWPIMPTINGNMRSALGIANTVWLDPGMVVNGTVTIGLSSYPTDPQGWQHLSGSNPGTDGIVFATASSNWALGGRAPGQASGTAAAAIDVFSPMTFPSTCSSAALFVPTSATLTINDGDPTWDLVPGDGKVTMCVPSVVTDNYASVYFGHPAQLFVKSSFANYGNTVSAVSSLLTRPDRGLTVIIGEPGQTTGLSGIMGRFKGSVYAPNAQVSFHLAATECSDRSTVIPRELGFVVSKSLSFLDMITLNLPTTSQASAPVVTMLSWTN